MTPRQIKVRAFSLASLNAFVSIVFAGLIVSVGTRVPALPGWLNAMVGTLFAGIWTFCACYAVIEWAQEKLNSTDTELNDLDTQRRIQSECRS